MTQSNSANFQNGHVAGIHRDDEALKEDDASFSRQWIAHNHISGGWVGRQRSPCHTACIKDERHVTTQLPQCNGNAVKDERFSNSVGDAKISERPEQRLGLPSSGSPLTPPHTKAELSRWTASPPRSFPEVLAAYMTSPMSSVAINGDVKSGITSGQMMISNELSNHHSVGSHVSVGDVNVPDAAGRSRGEN